MKANLKVSAATVAAIILLGSFPARAQNTAQVSIMGRVLPAYSLEPVAALGDANHEVSAIPQGRDRVLVIVHRRGQEVPSGVVTLVLALRTNAESYRLQATQLNGPGPVVLDVGAAQASGDASRVAANALSGFQAASNQPLVGAAQPVAAGSRISARGTFSSPNNALLVPVQLHLGAGDPSGSYQILLTLGA